MGEDAGWNSSAPSVRPLQSQHPHQPPRSWKQGCRDTLEAWPFWGGAMSNPPMAYTSVTVHLCPQTRGCKYTCLLAEQGRGKNFILYKPNIGKQSQPESLDSLFKKYRQVYGREYC